MFRKLSTYLAVIIGLLFFVTPDLFASNKSQLARGKYIFQLAGCNSCHTDKKKKDQMLAGGASIKTPFGVFYGPNITRDRQHGIGNWTEEEFIRAMQKGISPSGNQYFPAFPFTSYTKMTKEDLRNLKAYIFSLPPVAKKNKKHKIVFPVNIRWFQSLWKLLFFDQGQYKYIESRGDRWNRGAYLVNAVTHCGECHTPRNIFGGSKQGQFLAGTRGGANIELAPNITPDRLSGIGKWSNKDLTDALTFGILPDGDIVGGSMADVVENLSMLKTSDLQAIMIYLKSIPSIQNRINNN